MIMLSKIMDGGMGLVKTKSLSLLKGYLQDRFLGFMNTLSNQDL